MVVMKFGGSSVASAAAMVRVRAIVEAEPRPRVVVVSALGGVTDTLLQIAARAATGDTRFPLDALGELRERHAAIAAGVRDEADRRALLASLDAGWLDVATLVRAASMLRACPPAASDAIAAHGELASSRLIAAILRDAGLSAEWVDARAVIVTDGRHEQASPLVDETAARLSSTVGPLVARGAVPVIGGFIGSTAGGVTTTLGRGGLDHSASLVGACLGAAEIQIWTDVDGMLTADPRIFSRARTVEHLSFGEASALARFGAKVLHPSTVRPAVVAGIPVRILNSRRPAGSGTLVSSGPVRRGAPVAGIACLQNLCAFDVPLPDGGGRPAALADVFERCARAGAGVHLAAVSETGVAVVVDDGPAGDCVGALLEEPQRASRRGGLALVAAVGDRLASGHRAASRVLAACDAIPVQFLSRSSGSNHLAFVVDQTKLALAVAVLHERLFERRPESVAGLGRPADAGTPPPAYRELQEGIRA